MNLSKTERLILINQYEILKQLDNENATDYENLIEILINGYTTFYYKFDVRISSEVPEEVQRFVFDILDVYRVIEHYKRENPQDDQINNHPWNHFQGFDGNEETEYFSFVRFLINDENRFAEQIPYREATDEFNHHFPTLDKYQAMINQWNNLNRILDNHKSVMQVLQAE